MFRHRNGQLCCKHRGKHYYFGNDEATAHERYRLWDEAGRPASVPQLGSVPSQPTADKPATPTFGIRLRELCDRWLAAKWNKVKIGKLREATWKDYQRHCRLLAGRKDEAGRWTKGLLGDVVVDSLTEDDFVTLYGKFAGGSLHTLKDKIRMTRMILDWGAKRGYSQNPKYYESFDPPSKHEMRNGKREKLFTAEQIRAMLEGVKLRDPLRGMIFLGVNCGLGNTDCAHLTYDHLDLKKGILHYPRRKTGINRWCPLWPETVKALRKWLVWRPKNRCPYVFLNDKGEPFVKEGYREQLIAVRFSRLLKRLGFHQKYVSFYALRHTAYTIGKRARDPQAVSFIAGHSLRGMDDVYDEGSFDPDIPECVERLRQVTEYVRRWVFSG